MKENNIIRKRIKVWEILKITHTFFWNCHINRTLPKTPYFREMKCFNSLGRGSKCIRNLEPFTSSKSLQTPEIYGTLITSR